MKFNIKHKDTHSAARTGLIETDHGSIQTPIFMPVGTVGTAVSYTHLTLPTICSV